MRRNRIVASLVVLLALGGCATTQPPVTPSLPPASGGPVATPSVAATPAQAAPFNLTGKAMVLDAPLAGASVSVYVLGDSTPLVSGTTATDGSFSLLVPAEQMGTTYRVVAYKGTQHLVSLYDPGALASAYRVSETSGVVHVLLDLTTTMAYELLAPRLEAAGSVQASDSALAEAAFTAFTALSTGEKGLVSQPGSQADAVLSGVDDQGLLTLQPDTLTALGATATAAQRQAFEQAATQLGQALSAAIQAGRALDVALLGALRFGPSQTSSLVGAGSGGGSSDRLVRPGAGVTIVAPADGGFTAPAGATVTAPLYPSPSPTL